MRTQATVKTILVVDDEEILLRTLRRLLQWAGFQTETAQNAEEAITLAKKTAFDLILCDIKIPGADGFEIIRTIRHYSLLNQEICAPVIFMTGSIFESYENKVQQFPQAFLLRKPFGAYDLLHCIRNQVSGFSRAIPGRMVNAALPEISPSSQAAGY